MPHVHNIYIIIIQYSGLHLLWLYMYFEIATHQPLIFCVSEHIGGESTGESRLGGSRLEGSQLGGSQLGGSRLGGSRLGGSRLGGREYKE